MLTLLKLNPLKFLLQGFLVLVLFFALGVTTSFAAANDYTVSGGNPASLPDTGAESVALGTVTITDVGGDDFTNDPENIIMRINTASYPGVIFDSTVPNTDLGFAVAGNCTYNAANAFTYAASDTQVTIPITDSVGNECAAGQAITIVGLKISTIYATAAPAAAGLITVDNGTTAAGAPITTSSTVALAVTATDADATLTLANPDVGATGVATLAFTLSETLAANDTLTFTAPANLDVSGIGSTVTGTLEATDSVTCAAVGQDVTCTTSAASAVAGSRTIIMTGITGKYEGTDDIGGFFINDFSATPSLADINSDSTVAVSDTAVGALTSVSFTPGTYANITMTNYTVAFTIVGTSMANAGKLVIVFPSGYDVAQLSTATSSLSGLDGTWTAAVSGQTVTVTQSGGGATAAGAKSLLLSNIRNPETTGVTGTFSTTTQTSAAALIQRETSATVTIAGKTSTTSTLGDVTDVEVTDDEDTGGVIITWSDPSETDDDTTYIQILKGTDPNPVSGSTYALVAVGVEYYIDEDVEVGETVRYILRGTEGSDVGDQTEEVSFVVGSSLSEEESTEEESTEETEEEESTEEESEESTEEEVSGDDDDDTDDEDEEDDEVVEITDVADHWAADEIETMVDYGIVEGNPDGTFLPDGNLNRAEAAALLWRVLGLGDPEDQINDPFDDVDMGEWYAAYIGELSDLGLISGNPDGTYEPAENINRAEFLKLAMNVYIYLNPEMEGEYNILTDGEATDYFADLDTAEWYAGVVTAAHDWGFVSGSDCDEDKCFNAGSSITRAEATKILYNMFLDMLAYEGVSLELDLDSQTDDGILGTATLVQSGGRTWVEVILSVYGESDHPAHIHSGDCEDTGDIAWSLEDVVEGYSMTELEVSLANILDALPLYLNVHLSEDEIDTSAACGNI